MHNQWHDGHLRKNRWESKQFSSAFFFMSIGDPVKVVNLLFQLKWDSEGILFSAANRISVALGLSPNTIALPFKSMVAGR